MPPIVIGHLRLPSGELAGALLQCVLERLGHRVELVQAPARDLLARMGAGEIHLVSSAALQLAGPEWNRLRHDAVEVAALSEGHRFLWSIPDSPALRGVRTIADLARAPVRREVAAVEGGPAAHQSRAALQAYGLDAAGFRIREETMAHWRGLCRQAGADPDGFVIAHPSHHLLPEECEFRALADPLRALGGEFRTASVARAAVAGSLPPRTREVLRRVFTGAADLTEMEAQMRRMQAAPRALARAWLDANTRVSSSWLAEAPASQPR